MKLQLRLLAALAAVLVVFHVVAFTIPFAHTAVFWIAYGCTLVMFAVLGLTGCRVLSKKLQAERIILGWPMLRAAIISTAVQVVVFFALAVLSKFCTVLIASVAEVILLAAIFIRLLIRDTTESVVRNTEQHIPANTAVIKQLRAQAASMLKNNTDPALRRSLEKLNDALRYADPMSNAETAALEEQISELMANAETEADFGKILQLLNQRTELCKSGKER